MNALSNRVAWLVGSTLSLLLSVGCDRSGSDIDNNLGTETNWLVACVSNTECGALACECGVCTDTCASDSTCTMGGASCSKATSGQVGDLCQNYAPPAAGLCLPACSISCSQGEVCLGDRCIAPGLGLDAPVGAPDAATSGPVPVSSATSTSTASAGGSPTAAASTVSNVPDAALTSDPADAAVPVPVSSNDAGPACDFDSCHPERCDAIGEPCCDPLPADGPNYCNGDLACESGSCAVAPFGPVCGDNQCAAGEVCCDRCDGSCAPAASGASCAEDSRPAAYQCDAIGDPFYCGPSTVCTSPLQQYCTVQERNGLRTNTSYSCTDGPGRCVRTQTCDCLLQELPDDPGATCVQDAGGMMTVTLSPVVLPI